MKFNPLTRELFTDTGELIKKMYCPIGVNADSLLPTNTTDKLCSKCDKTIVDTSVYTDEDLLALLKEKPDTCLTANLNRENITTIVQGDMYVRH